MGWIRTGSAVACGLAVLLGSVPSRADAGAVGTSALPAEPSRASSYFPAKRAFSAWYGAWILAPSLLMDISTTVWIASDSSAPDRIRLQTTTLLLTGRAFLAPIVHMARGHVGRGLASLGLHLTMSFGLGTLGALLGNPLCEDEMSCANGHFWGGFSGLVVGSLAATALDTTLLAYDAPPATQQTSHRSMPFAIHLAPSVTTRSLGLSVVGVF